MLIGTELAGALRMTGSIESGSMFLGSQGQQHCLEGSAVVLLYSQLAFFLT